MTHRWWRILLLVWVLGCGTGGDEPYVRSVTWRLADLALGDSVVLIAVQDSATGRPVRATICLGRNNGREHETDDTGLLRVSGVRPANLWARVVAAGYREEAFNMYPGKRGRSDAVVRLRPGGDRTPRATCGETDGRSTPAPKAAAIELPTVIHTGGVLPTITAEPRFVITGEQGGPEQLAGLEIAVSRRGDVVFTTGFDTANRLVTLADSGGTIRARFARRGQGPGEFDVFLLAFVDESRVLLASHARLAEFSLDGEHRWTRTIPPNEMVLAVHGDSIDTVDAVRAASREPSAFYRRAIRSGGGRLLASGDSSILDALSRAQRDSTRHVWLAFTSSLSEFIVGNGSTFRLLRVRADGRPIVQFGAERVVRRLSEKEIDDEVRRQIALASRPFRLPDGSTRINPVNVEEIRRRATMPKSHFSARFENVWMDPRTGDVFVIEPLDDSVRVTRFARTGKATGAVAVACAARQSPTALNWPFLALACEGEHAGEPELRLFRLSN